MRLLAAALALLFAIAARADVIELRDGRWFDGERFAARTMYSVDGVLRERRPQRVDRVVRLDGKFVIPPFAEAHNHWLEPAAIADYNRRYLADGVFYVMDQANVPFVAEQVRAATNRPGAVDYISAVLGFTGPGGHPLEIIGQFIGFGIFPASWKGNEDKNAILIVRDERDVEERWPVLKAAHPDFVKIFLQYSEEYAQRVDDPASGADRGLDPRLVAPIVKRAHRDGLRVSAHIYRASDFRNAVAGGVDIVAHMPGTGAGEHADRLARYRISAADARAAAKAGVKVITTLSWLADLRGEKDGAALAERIEKEVIAPNVRQLVLHGVPLLIGSDRFRETPIAELFELRRLGFSNRTILRIATRDTARAIFPARKIGTLGDGYEASFLVLDGDPLLRLENIGTILLRVKRGEIVH